jgi:uncharacterized membrane protein
MAQADAGGEQARHGVPPARSSAAARARHGRLAAAVGSVTGLTIASLAGSLLGFEQKAACWSGGAWNYGTGQFQAHCYSDIYPLYFGEGLSSGKIPYLDHPVEYPVLIGAAMEAAGWLVRGVADPYARGTDFFFVTVAMLAVFALAGVLATAYLAGPSRRWTAIAVALAPGLVLASFINWDLIAMSLAALGLAAWAGRRGVLAGVLIGLATATKFYPVLLLGPLLLLCLRAGRLRAWGVTAASAAVAWLVVDLPVAIVAPTGWARFYVFNAQRGADWGSIWYFFEAEHWPVLGSLQLSTLNLVSVLAFAACCVLIGLLIMAAPRRPRVAQVGFLIVAAFLMCNKVWSPQYVIWLAPLVVLARPRLWSWALWQVAEIGYFFAIWAYLITMVPGPHPADVISPALYFCSVLARFGTVALLCALVIRDVLRPEADVVRSDGVDDPAGGVLADAPDRVVWRPLAARPEPTPG